MFHQHQPLYTGFKINAVYEGKGNWPEGDKGVHSTGFEAFCRSCKIWLIVHDEPHPFPQRWTELEREVV